MKKTSAARYPLLAEFARGYLHQDLIPEFGDPLRAAVGYLADIDDEAKPALAKEAGRMRDALKGLGTEQMNHRFLDLGSAWRFSSTEEVMQLLDLFERGH